MAAQRNFTTLLLHLPKQLNAMRSYHKSSIYVHWPYCTKLCTYCNFNKYLSAKGDDVEMQKCLVLELETMIRLTQTEEIHSVYFGGGTPSLAGPDTVVAILNSLAQLCNVPADVEISLEANPSEWHKFQDFKLAGINRLSIGLQCLVDRDLLLFNRSHSRECGLKALETGRGLFPGRTSVDVLFGRPSQTLESWREELKEITKACDSHVSLYELTVEQGTPLARSVKNGTVMLPNEDLVADMYLTALQELSRNNIHRYEVSNFAVSGSECVHNMHYWQGGEYIGIGPGAHSRISLPANRSQRLAVVHTPEPKRWMKQVLAYGCGTAKSEHLSSKARIKELIMTMLRTRQGMLYTVLDGLFPGYSSSAHDLFRQSDTISGLVEENLLQLDERGLRATDAGLNVVDSIVCDVFDCQDQAYDS
uniref:Radical S-adenosyl methionine domain-containing protein 1, mitochondrial n=1 Tax=Halisarca dujardinii TaxID=2583056 RepID=A0A6C0PP09_HALDU|nr:radical S-adenosyl methionine domain containing protein 1 [Halisarca dujardinii]